MRARLSALLFLSLTSAALFGCSAESSRAATDTSAEPAPRDATDDGVTPDTTSEDVAAADVADDSASPSEDTGGDSAEETSGADAVEGGKCGDGVLNVNEECDEGAANAVEPCAPTDGEACEYCSIHCRLERVDPVREIGSVEGWVLDRDDASPIEGASVSIRGGVAEATTDADGRFRLEEVDAGERVLLDVSVETPADAAPYSTTQVVVEVRAGTTTFAYPELLRGCSDFVTVTALEGATATASDCEDRGGRTQIAFAPSGLQRADGAPFSGAARVDLIPIPIPRTADGPDLSAWDAFPGDMRAERVDGSEAELQSWGAAEIRVTDAETGAPLQIAEGTRARLRLQVYDRPTGNAPVTAWWYDEDAGLWIEEGVGTFVVEDGLSYYDVEVSHLTWWNCDEPLRNKTCVWGNVVSDGSRFPRLPVTANGVDYAGTSRGYTDSGGQFCVNVRPASVVRVDIPTARLDGFPEGVSSIVETGAPGISCERFFGSCQYIGNLPGAPVISEDDVPAPPDIPPPPPPDVPDSACVQASIQTDGGVTVGTTVTITAFDPTVTPLLSADLASVQATGAVCANVPGETSRVAVEWTASDGTPCLHTMPVSVGTEERSCGGDCIDLGVLGCGR